MDATEAAWLAGFFEGEGRVGLNRRGGRYAYPSLRCTSPDKDVIDTARRIAGVGTVTVRRFDNPAHQDSWVWSVNRREDFEHVARIIEPYLHPRRLNRLAEVRAGATEPRYPKPPLEPRLPV